MKPTSIKIAVADDHEIIRIGLERVFAMIEGMHVVATYADAHAVLQANFVGIDVLVLDLNMPGSDGIALITAIVSRYPELKVAVFSMLPEDSFAPRAMAAGAAAFVNKNQPPEEIVTAIRMLMARGQYVSEAQANLLLAREAEFDSVLHASLSQREFEILVLIAGGAKPTDVAKRLALKIGTVTTHVHRIKRKLGANSLGDLVAYGHRHQLVGT